MAKRVRGADRLKEELRGRLAADINVTPFIDVILVLLIFFLVITPILLYAFNTDLPQAGAAASAWEPEEEFVLTLTDANVIQVNGVEVSEYPELKDYIDYLKKFSEIDFDQLIGELSKAEDNIYSSLLK